MAAKKESKKELSREEYRELRDAVYTFFYYSNKPVNATEIFMQFKNCRKGDVEKTLEDLAQKGRIFIKVFSKQKFYCLAQNIEYEIDDPNYTDEVDAQQDQKEEDKVLRFLKWKRNELMGRLKEVQARCAELDEEIAMKSSQLSTEELVKAIEGMKEFIEENAGLEDVEIVPVEDVENQKIRMATMKKELQSRKRLYREVTDSLCEGMEMKKKDLLAEAGIEEA